MCKPTMLLSGLLLPLLPCCWGLGHWVLRARSWLEAVAFRSEWPFIIITNTAVIIKIGDIHWWLGITNSPSDLNHQFKSPLANGSRTWTRSKSIASYVFGGVGALQPKPASVQALTYKWRLWVSLPFKQRNLFSFGACGSTPCWVEQGPQIRVHHVHSWAPAGKGASWGACGPKATNCSFYALLCIQQNFFRCLGPGECLHSFMCIQQIYFFRSPISNHYAQYVAPIYHQY